MKYGNIDNLYKDVLHKRVVNWSSDKLTLDDGTILTLEMSESDCCASAGGEFKDVQLDAVITDIEIGEIEEGDDGDTVVNTVDVKLLHNLNPIAVAEMYADAGNGGYYYSVASLVVNGVHYHMVDA